MECSGWESVVVFGGGGSFHVVYIGLCDSDTGAMWTLAALSGVT